jgi:hypothetical protein
MIPVMFYMLKNKMEATLMYFFLGERKLPTMMSSCSFSKKHDNADIHLLQPRRRDGENFKNFQAAATRIVSSPTGLEFFLIFPCFFLKKLSIKVGFFRNQTLH